MLKFLTVSHLRHLHVVLRPCAVTADCLSQSCGWDANSVNCDLDIFIASLPLELPRHELPFASSEILSKSPFFEMPLILPVTNDRSLLDSNQDSKKSSYFALKPYVSSILRITSFKLRSCTRYKVRRISLKNIHCSSISNMTEFDENETVPARVVE